MPPCCRGRIPWLPARLLHLQAGRQATPSLAGFALHRMDAKHGSGSICIAQHNSQQLQRRAMRMVHTWPWRRLLNRRRQLLQLHAHTGPPLHALRVLPPLLRRLPLLPLLLLVPLLPLAPPPDWLRCLRLRLLRLLGAAWLCCSARPSGSNCKLFVWLCQSQRAVWVEYKGWNVHLPQRIGCFPLRLFCRGRWWQRSGGVECKATRAGSHHTCLNPPYPGRALSSLQGVLLDHWHHCWQLKPTQLACRLPLRPPLLLLPLLHSRSTATFAYNKITRLPSLQHAPYTAFSVSLRHPATICSGFAFFCGTRQRTASHPHAPPRAAATRWPCTSTEA